MAIEINEDNKSGYLEALEALSRAAKSAKDYSGSDKESMRRRNKEIERAYEHCESARQAYLNI